MYIYIYEPQEIFMNNLMTRLLLKNPPTNTCIKQGVIRKVTASPAYSFLQPE